MDTIKLLKIGKKVGKVAITVGLPMVMNYFDNKALDEKITKKVSEALSKSEMGES